MNTKLNLSENAIKVLKRRYLIKDNQGEVTESPEELFWRVAKAIASAEKNYGSTEEEVEKKAREFYDLMSNLEFLPNSPTLMNAGRPLGQLSACFVLPIQDSMESIFDAVKNTALIHKSGGGTGFAFSKLRPKNSVVASTSGVASGPISFMKVINAATEAVKQGGTRRGANMGVLRIDHPDILEFITSKEDLSELNNFNISVAVTDEFMMKAEKDEFYDLIDPRTQNIYSKNGNPVRLRAKEVFEMIVNQAWKTGEPGVMFIDRMNKENPISKVGLFESTNPCGEQPLLPYESCNLGSINLSKMVKKTNDSFEIDWDKLERVTRTAVEFLDNVIDVNKYPLPQIEENTKMNRKIGLGVMGWADLLVQLRIPYGSDEAVDLGEKVMSFVQERSHLVSSELAKRRGNFPNWSKSVYYDKNTPMRNATVTTIAPTGTISIIASCSSGIEPFFAICYIRNVMDQTRLTEVNPYFEKEGKSKGFLSQKLLEQIAEKNSLKKIDQIPEEVKKIYVTSFDIARQWHVKMQAVFQKYTDNAVSKTINLPNGAKGEDVEEAYKLAYRLGCKGITIYRDQSRKEQVLSVKAAPAKPKVTPMERPSTLSGITEKIKTGYGNLYVTVNTLNGKPFEVFAQIGKSGYSTMADTEAICRLISLALRSRIGLDQIIGQLVGIGGASPVFQEGGLIMSIPDAIAKVLTKHFGNGKNFNSDKDLSLERCPDCGAKLEYDGGCVVCRSCGYSKC
ncbi:MAG: ribonucleotide-diphosphate reductase subunit alpha [candidate division Zixibacteria bacterium SM23_73_2]|nr:MAG: ribonucleotide-diphosphate reductase subunit alpha [candidate division Zixibacteria bacterium SM23_73_2]